MKHLQFRWTFVFGGLVTMFFLLCAVVSLIWTPYDPNFINVDARFSGMGSPGHLLGTDTVGRDLFSALLVGSRLSIALGCLTAALSVFLGAVIAFIAVDRTCATFTNDRSTGYGPRPRPLAITSRMSCAGDNHRSLAARPSSGLRKLPRAA